jgi:hypothetical protein
MGYEIYLVVNLKEEETNQKVWFASLTEDFFMDYIDAEREDLPCGES